jgi:ATP-dependent helicase STH1/SNF2
LELSEEE